MTKRAFNKVLNACRNKAKTALDIDAISKLDDATKIDCLLHIVRSRGPLLVNFIPDNWLDLPSFFGSGTNDNWLDCMGYLYKTPSAKTGLVFRHTGEQTIK